MTYHCHIMAYHCNFYLQLHFMICLTANYTRIRISKELTEYRDAVDMEELELNTGMEKSSQQYWHRQRWLDPRSRLTTDTYSDEEEEEEEYRENERYRDWWFVTADNLLILPNALAFFYEIEFFKGDNFMLLKSRTSSLYLHSSNHRGQNYFNIACVLQDKWLTIFTRPANTCTCPLKRMQ